MAVSVHHGRSLSLPSTLKSFTSQIDENLSRVKDSQDTSSLSSFSDRISGLENLCYNLDNFLSSPHTQQIISQEKRVDQVMDSHIRLLDACNSAREIFSYIKHNVQDILSSIRRKDVNGVNCYLTSRKNSRKMIQKSLKDLRSSRNKQAQSFDNKIMNLFEEVESSTFGIFESLLFYAIGTKTPIIQGSWSLVSMMKSKKMLNQVEETNFNEFVKIDTSLQTGQDNDMHVKGIVNHLKDMELNIQTLEEDLECLFKQFIKIRVSLLNSLNY